jgi:hypothetical protein
MGPKWTALLSAALYLTAAASGGAPPTAPSWAVASAPALGAPLCGFRAARHEATVVYRATAEIGTYNHAAMLDYNFGTFLLTVRATQGCSNNRRVSQPVNLFSRPASLMQ